MTQSILGSTKKILGLAESDDSFDVDVILHINSVFSILHQIGIGPDDGFMIEDSTETWDTFLGTDPLLNPVKTYVYFRVRVWFDPPTTSFAIESMNRQIAEFEWRLNVQAESVT